jgi:hypothetical protein
VSAKAAQKHNALRSQVREAILAILEGGPVGPRQLTGRVLEQVPEATRDDVAAVRTTLMGKTGQIEIRGNRVCLSGFDRTKPITAVEKEVVACLGAGKTPREVVEACELVRNAFSARTILSALVARGVIAERPGCSPRVFESLEVPVG